MSLRQIDRAGSDHIVTRRAREGPRWRVGLQCCGIVPADIASLQRCRRGVLGTILLSLLLAFPALVLQGARLNAGQPVPAKHGIVVSVSAPASESGVAILKKGGNAVDAAVATAFALAVTYPQAGNIGGGGFMLVYPGGKAEPAVIDYRETAPAAATRTMFAKQDGLYGYKVIGVPGTVRGLALAHQRFGKLPWKDVVKPALLLAEHGFPVSEHLAGSLNWLVWDARDFPELRRIYGKPNGTGEW